jgi:ribosomal protein L37E
MNPHRYFTKPLGAKTRQCQACGFPAATPRQQKAHADAHEPNLRRPE